MVPEAEAAHEVPHPITDLSQPVPSGTVIEYDLNWNAFSPSGWYVLTIFIDNGNYNGHQEYLAQFDQDANCLAGGGYCFQIELIKEGEWDYLLRIHTDGESSGGPSNNALVDGDHKIQVSLNTTPTSEITGYSTFTIGEADTTPPVVSVPNDLTFTITGSTKIIETFEYSSAGGTFPPHAVDDVDGILENSGEIVCSIGGGGQIQWSYHLWPVGTTTVTCTATDAAGNVGTASFTVTVAYTPAGPVASTSPPSAYSQVTAISGLNNPISVAVDNYGNVHVADTGDDVVKKFNSSLELLFTISGLSNPFDVGVDNNGNIYVLDQGTNSVKKYDSSGTFITQSSIPGTVQSLSVVNNKVYVTATNSGSFRVLDSSLNNLLTVPGTNGHNYYPQGITADSSGNIYVFNALDGPNTYGGEIKKYSSSGQITNVFGGYTSTGELGKFSHQVFGIEVDSSGNIYAAEHNRKIIQVLDSSGNLVRWFGEVGSGLGQFGRLNDVTVDSAGNIYTAEPWENSRIQIFPPNYGQAPPDDTTPATITATAYLNATSPTGRTLSLVGVDIGTVEEYETLFTTISKDGTVVAPYVTEGYSPIPFAISNYWQPTWQIPIPEDWAAGSYDVTWEIAHGVSNNVPGSSTTVTVPSLPEPGTTPATITATAYLNATSPTGRTLSLVGVDIGTVDSGETLLTTIYKDGAVVVGPTAPSHFGCTLGCFAINNYWQPTWQIPIPENWEAGSYDVTWNVRSDGTIFPGSSTTVTVPALSEPDTTPATITATAYLNATSPTGRTLSLVGVDIGTVEEYETLLTTIYKDGTVVSPIDASYTTLHHACPSGCFAINNDYGEISDSQIGGAATWQTPIPGDWEAGTYDITWNVYHPNIPQNIPVGTVISSSSTTVTVPAFPTPYINPSAYLNDTSPTGRTLNLDLLDFPTRTKYVLLNSPSHSHQIDPNQADEIRLQSTASLWATMDKDGVNVFPALSSDNTPKVNFWLRDSMQWQIPVPEDWEAGSYNVTWDVYDCVQYPSSWYEDWCNAEYVSSSSAAVTIPPLPGTDTTPATITATAYLNATSPTGRTLSLVGVDIGTVNEGETLLTTIYKDGAVVVGPTAPSHYGCTSGCFAINNYWQPTWQIPIPEDWEAGTYDITWNVANAGIVSTGSSTTVTVPSLSGTESDIDMISPVIASPTNIYIQTTDPTGKTVSFVTPTSTDNVGVNTVSCSPDSGSFFTVGNTNVICTATDAAGNIGVGIFVVSVTYALTDEDSPSFTQVSNQSVSITNSTGTTFSYGAPTVTDNIGVTVGPTCTPPSGDLFPVGQTVVTCTASDSAGNSGTMSFIVTIVNTEAVGDVIAPSFAAVQDISVEAIVSNGAEVEFDIPAATDDQAVTIGPSCTPEPGHFFPIGDTIVTCTAKDEAENQGTTTFIVSVESRIQAPDEAPTEEIPELSVSTVDSITVEGDTVSSIDAGELGYFETSLTTNSTSSVLVTVSVMSADQTTLGVGFFKSIIGTGQSDIVLGFQVPKDTISGDANVYVNVFTDWPELGGVLITDEMNMQVEIIGVEPGEITEQVVESPDEELAKLCGEGTHLEDGVCVIEQDVKLELQLGSINVKNASPVLGSSNATITIVQFAEYQDEPSYTWFSNTRPDLIKDFVETGKANLVFVDMPFLGNDSTLASQATYCADEQDRYWPYHFMLFNMQDGPPDSGWADRENLNSFAFNLGLDLDEFNGCMDSGKYHDRIQFNYDEGIEQGVISTPTFFIVFPDGTIEKISGAQPYSVFASILESEPVVEPESESDTTPPVITVPSDQTFTTTDPTGYVYNFEVTATDNVAIDTTRMSNAGPGIFCVDYVPNPTPPGTLFPLGTTNVVCSANDTAGNYGQSVFTVTVVLTDVEPESELQSSGMQATVQNAQSSSIPGCEETDSCFTPSKVKIDLGGTVTWENNDSAAHTTTSCINSNDGSCQIVGLEWDSSLMVAGESFSHTFDTAGTYDYFCMVHPWMEGVVFVEEMEVEEVEVIEEEPNVQEVGVLGLAIDDNNILLDGTNHVRIQNEDLIRMNDKITISGWIKPDFSENMRLSAVSKSNSFDLFVTGNEDPKHHVGLSVFNGEKWNTVFGNSVVSESWHHIVGVVNMSDFSIFLDGQLDGHGTLDTTLGLDEKGRLAQQDSTMNVSEEDVIVGSLEISSSGANTALVNRFSGTVFDIKITNDTLSDKQIFELYDVDKHVYQRKDILELQKMNNTTLIENPSMSTESPKLTANECIELAKERGLYDDTSTSEVYTLVCQFPFDVIIPINSRLLWIETLSLENAPYHSIRSVDNLFSTGGSGSADMGFYNDTFTHGVYGYYDDFDESLTGNIIITNPTNVINIPDGIGAGCEYSYSCFDTFAAVVSVGEKLTWQNKDTDRHTVISGTPGDGPNGIFESGLLGTYDYFAHMFDESGTYDYFCMVHPWMEGKIIVGEV